MKKFPPLLVLAKGLATSIPGAYSAFCKGSGGTNSVRYCYAVWMRHLVLTQKAKADFVPKVVGELGPGDSIGIGLASLLSGAEKYFALDAVKHINIERNLQFFEELVVMFRNKEKIPDEKEFPRLVPLLENYDFPEYILTDEVLNKTLAADRLELIKKSIIDSGASESVISYFAPWDDQGVIAPATADLIFSQYVLEHVNDLKKTYSAMYTWLKPGGMISNVIDFQCHGTSVEWNGQWQYSRFMWKLIVGGRPFLLNREPAEAHLEFIRKNNFKLLKAERFYRESEVTRDSLAAEFAGISDEDLKTLKIYTLAVK